jgi:hypothetical protein
LERGGNDSLARLETTSFDRRGAMTRDTAPGGPIAGIGDGAVDADGDGNAGPQSGQPGGSHTKRWRGWLGPAMVVMVLLIGLSGAYPWGCASGEIRSRGAPHGEFTVKVAECYSAGEAWSSDVRIITRLERTWDGRTGFRGGLDLVEDSTGGWRAVLESPHGCNGFECPQRPVDRRHCQVFDVRSEARGWWWRRRGHARLDCSFPEGGTLKAELAFRGCAIVMPLGGDP